MNFLTIPNLYTTTFYAIPDYQRDYEWSNINNSTLLEDVIALMNSDEKFHFFGAIVTIPYDKTNATTMSIDLSGYDNVDTINIKHVVDGQQRLVSFSILARVVKDLVDEKFKENPALDNLSTSVTAKLERFYFSDSYKGDSRAPALILNGNTGRCYNSEILKTTKQLWEKDYKGAKKLLAAYKLFKKEIPLKCAGSNLSEQQFYKQLVETLRNKVKIVEISCDGDVDAFQVFDSLNGKGLNLTVADRIKNILMSWAPEDDRNEIWDNLAQKVGEKYLAGFFISSFFYIKSQRVSKNRLPEEFKKIYKKDAAENFDSFIQELYKNGEIYGKLRNCSTEKNELDGLLKNLKDIKMEQIYVMLMAAVFRYGEDVISKKDYVVFVLTLTKLVVRMQVCERSMNTLDVKFIEWINRMKEPTETLKSITLTIANSTKSFVSDESFKDAFAHYAPTDNKISEYYLTQLEKYYRNKCKLGDRTTLSEEVTVEHIIPHAYSLGDWYENKKIPAEIKASFTSDVVENIGNKALLFGDDNTSALNKNYKVKLDVYRNGKRMQNKGVPYESFALIKKLVDEYPDKFTHKEVFDRAKKLAEAAVEIW